MECHGPKKVKANLRLDAKARAFKGGSAYGSTDERGAKVAENPAYCYDLHATALHLLGIDHEKLTFYNNGAKRRLTDVHGHVIKPLLA